jgi:hypothetical protein
VLVVEGCCPLVVVGIGAVAILVAGGFCFDNVLHGAKAVAVFVAAGCCPAELVDYA